MQISNREKNIIGAMALDGIVTIYYFSQAMTLSPGSGLTGAAMGFLVGKTVALAIILAIVWQILVNGRRDPEAADERDAAIEGRANAIGYRVLQITIGLLMAAILTANGWSASPVSQLLTTPFYSFHALVLVLTASSFAKHASQLAFYRREY